MDTEEWDNWQKLFPELGTWLSKEAREKFIPERIECFEAVEQRAFCLTKKQIERFLSLLTTYVFHKLEDKELELIIRVILEYHNGRQGDLILGDLGRRLKIETQKRHFISEGYLKPFIEIVHAELN